MDINDKKALRNIYLCKTDWTFQRYLEQKKLIEEGYLDEYTMPTGVVVDVLKYRQDLRDVGQTEINPDTFTIPSGISL